MPFERNAFRQILMLPKISAAKYLLVLPLCFLPVRAEARVAANPPALATDDWSVKSPHSLALNPPSPDRVCGFMDTAYGGFIGHVCDFRFADLRHSGNLSLIVSNDGGGTADCNYTTIFDKTPTGFESYDLDMYANVYFSKDDGVEDINQDGNSQLVVWTWIGLPTSEMGEECSWPRIFAWTGNGYSEVNAHYKKFYENFLNSLQRQLAKEPAPGEVQTPEPAESPANTTAGFRFGSGRDQSASASPAPSIQYQTQQMQEQNPEPQPEPTEEPNYDCLRIEAAKTENLLGSQSTEMMTWAVKAQASKDPYERKLSAVVLSYIRTPEAMVRLRELGSDTDKSVAEDAKDLLSGEFGESIGSSTTATGERIQWQTNFTGANCRVNSNH
jgi:hypothetical protein